MVNPWKSLSQKKVYDNPWIELTEHQVINPNGGKGIYGVVHFKNLAIGVIALSDHLDIWLVGQYRFPLNEYSWEIPEGGGSLVDDPLLSAKRELKEETGVEAQSWFEIGRMHLSNSVSDELSIVYLALDLKEGVAEPEETEELKILKIPFMKAYEMVNNGDITDSLSVFAILKIKIMLDASGNDLIRLKKTFTR
jgi:ADP-ribose pyrophosphatase